MSKRRKLLSLLLAVLLFVPLTGCYDRVELEGIAFVLALAVDKAEDGNLEVTAHIAIPRKIAGGSGGGGGGGGDEIAASKPITVEAHSIPEALDLLNTTVERRVSLLHLASLSFGEKFAEQGVIEPLRSMARYREFRRTVYMSVMKGRARDVLLANKPIVEQSLTRFIDSVADLGRYTGLAPNTMFHEFLVSSEMPNQDPICPVLAINQHVQSDQGKGESANKGKSDEENKKVEQGPSGKKTGEESEGPNLTIRPGEVKREGGNPVDFVGAAVFKKDKLVTFLDGIDTRMLMNIRGELSRTQMDFPDPLEKGKNVSVELKHSHSPSVEVDLFARPMRIKIRQTLEGDLIGSQGKTDYTRPDKMQVLETSIRKRLGDRQKELIERVYHEYQAEPFGLLRKVRSQFATFDEFAAYDFRKALQECQVDVDVELRLRRVGVQLAPISVE